MEWMFLFTRSSTDEVAALSSFMLLHRENRECSTRDIKTSQHITCPSSHLLYERGLAVLFVLAFSFLLLLVLSFVALHVALSLLLSLVSEVHHLFPFLFQLFSCETPKGGILRYLIRCSPIFRVNVHESSAHPSLDHCVHCKNYNVGTSTSVEHFIIYTDQA